MTEDHQGSVSAFLRNKGLTRLAALVLNWPNTVLGAAVLLVGASCWLIATRLEMKTAHSDLMSEKDRSAVQFKELMEEFGTPYVLIGVLECEPAQFKARRELAERMKRELETVRVPVESLDLGVAAAPGAMTNLVKSADYRLDMSSLKGRELYLASTNDLAYIRHTLEEQSPWLRKLSAAPTLEGFFRMADERFAVEQKRGKVGNDAETVQELEVFAQLFDRMRQAATDQAWRPPEGSFWEEMFIPPSAGNMCGELREGYFTSFDGRLMFMFIQPTSNSRNVDVLRQLVDGTRAAFHKFQPGKPAFGGIKLSLTGEPADAVSEADSTSRDMQFFGAVSLIGVSVLLMLGFRGFRFPLMLVGSLGVGMAWTFGLTTLFIGHLNLLSQVVPIILIGLGMDFGIHLLTRYREQRRRGSQRPEALREAIVENGMSIIMSAITTAVAFFSISVDNFKGFVEMGLIAGMGVMCCLAAMLVVLPALLAMQRRFQPTRDAVLHPPAVPVGVDAAEPLHPPFVEIFFQYPWWILAAGAVITAALLTSTIRNWDRISFDYKISNLSAPGTESVIYEARMMEESDFTANASLICKDMKQAEEISRRLRTLPSVKKIESLHSRFLGDVAEKQAILAGIVPLLAGVFETPPASQPVDPKQLAELVGKLADRLENYQEMAMDGGHKALVKPLGLALAAAKQFQAMLQDADAKLARRLGRFQDYFMGDLARQIARFRADIQAGPITQELLPKDLVEQFIGKTGKVQVMAYLKGEMWNRPALTTFLTECRSLGVPVTGPLVEYYEMTKVMREGFDKAAIYACVAVYLLLLADFRRFKTATLTMVPDLLGTAWMVGLMGLCGLSFNPANLMVLPLIIGIGLANGVHIMHRFREARDADISRVVWHTGLAVTLGSLVTVVGFGCLGLAHNLGISSIGKALTLGVGARILTSIVILPAMLVIVQRRKWKV